MRRTLGGVGVGVAAIAVSGLFGAACSNSPVGPARGGETTTTVRVPPHQHATGSTSTTAVGAGGTTTTEDGGAGGAGAGASPTLGVASAWGSSAIGFGRVKPAEISLGGDPTGVLTGISWQSWGGSTATGTGRGTYVAPNAAVAQSSPQPATVVALDLGTCNGTPAYKAVKWYYPDEGESLTTGANSTIHTCSGP